MSSKSGIQALSEAMNTSKNTFRHCRLSEKFWEKKCLQKSISCKKIMTQMMALNSRFSQWATYEIFRRIQKKHTSVKNKKNLFYSSKKSRSLASMILIITKLDLEIYQIVKTRKGFNVKSNRFTTQLGNHSQKLLKVYSRKITFFPQPIQKTTSCKTF